MILLWILLPSRKKIALSMFEFNLLMHLLLKTVSFFFFPFVVDVSTPCWRGVLMDPRVRGQGTKNQK